MVGGGTRKVVDGETNGMAISGRMRYMVISGRMRYMAISGETGRVVRFSRLLGVC